MRKKLVMNGKDKHPSMALPLQARPVNRESTPGVASGAQTGPGVEAAARCSQMKGLARQMCYASKGTYV